MPNVWPWLRNHWAAFVAIVAVLTWGISLEARVDHNQTKLEAQRDKAEVIQVIEHRLDLMNEQIALIKADVAYIRGQIETNKE